MNRDLSVMLTTLKTNSVTDVQIRRNEYSSSMLRTERDRVEEARQNAEFPYFAQCGDERMLISLNERMTLENAGAKKLEPEA